MMLDKKKIQMVFLFEFKMGRKAVETTCTINNAFGPGPANEQTVQQAFRKLCAGGESLDGEEHGGWPSEVDSDRLRGSSKLVVLQLHEKLLKNSTPTILQPFGI